MIAIGYSQRFETGRQAYMWTINEILVDGEVIAPRGEKTYELRAVTLIIDKPWDALPTGVDRRLVPAIGIAEGLQLVAATSEPELLTRISPAFERYRESDGSMHGAYGLRVTGCIEKIIRLLAHDPDSRQAVINIWDSQLDQFPYGGLNQVPRDLPCTISLHFLIRGEELELHTHMRSNDVWLGLPYDLHQFTMLQQSVARALKISPGPYVHVADSLHLYERDLSKAEQLTWKPDAPHYDDRGVGRDDQSWEEISFRAKLLLRGKTPANPTETEVRYATALRKYQ